MPLVDRAESIRTAGDSPVPLVEANAPRLISFVFNSIWEIKFVFRFRTL